MRRSVSLLLFAVALSAGTAAVARRIDAGAARIYDVAFVPSSNAMRWLSLGHPTLVANLNWLRTVQYVGEPRGDERGWDRLRPLAELVTDLDPKHGYAYQVTGNQLASAGLIADSNAILEKGFENVPDRYILPFHRAVNAFLYEGDYALAGRYFERAARTPGAPAHLRDYVLAMYVKGDAPGAAISFLEHLYARAEDDETRRALEKQLAQAHLERDAARLEAAAEAYTRQIGVRPITPVQLVMEGLVSSLPADPFGGEYFLDEAGRVHSTVHERRFERPAGGAARTAAMYEAQGRLKAMEHAQP
ncbi:tetratricopeptide repeat protein [Anaeromyxobacter terrae]|uniref:tetratricopeptide repeat protein n=1 Tax=Anaeromyxobacter terrae TaxID=2925406 RepID=UPI001F569745|nr:tetratricopeptide repeat protein [Anaeromyxobacter sp. SG22]